MKSRRIGWWVMFPFRLVAAIPMGVVFAIYVACDREGWSILKDGIKELRKFIIGK